MVLWGSVWGLIFGAYAIHGDMGWLLGLIGGSAAGWTLRYVVAAEFEKKTQALELALARVTAEWKALAIGEPSSGLSVEPKSVVPKPAKPMADSLARVASVATTPVRASRPQAPTPSITREPDVFEKFATGVSAWLMGGNTIVRVGLVILFIGLSFLARYAANAGLLPIEFRLAALGVAATAMLAFGFSKRVEKPGFGLALQGAGVAVLYLTIFAAFRLYDLLPSTVAMGLLVVVCALGCALALLQNSLALAAAAFIGGFAAPILLSTGQGNHVGLFGYYAVLNVGIVSIAYWRSWRALNLIGFLATFGVATAWGVLKFLPEQYGSAQVFLALFIAMYVLAAILYARKTPTQLGHAVDSTLVFGTPLIGFALQAGLMKSLQAAWQMPFDPLAFAAVAFAFVYVLLAMWLRLRGTENYQLLGECFIALGLGFATLAIPLALDVRWTSATWALEGMGAFWVGMRQARWMPRAFGLLLQAIAGFLYISTLEKSWYADASAVWFANPVFIGALLIAVPSMVMAWWTRRPLAASQSTWARAYVGFELGVSQALFVYALVFWCLGFALELYGSTAPAHWLQLQRSAWLMLWLLGTSAALLWVGIAKQWTLATKPSHFSLLVLFLFYGDSLLHGQSVFVWPLALLWSIAAALHYVMLYAYERQVLTSTQSQASIQAQLSKASSLVHAGGVWFVCAVLADGLWRVMDASALRGTSWASVVGLFSCLAMLMVLTLWAGRPLPLQRWPLRVHADSYLWTAATPLALLAIAGATLLGLLSNGNAAPLPYLPLLNPVDLSLALSVGILLLWRKSLQAHLPNVWAVKKEFLFALTALGFLSINTVWLRVSHHYLGVPWRAADLFASFYVQLGYAILWSVTALGLMVLGSKRGHRVWWWLGAGLFAVVVSKLFLIDLKNSGGAERIVAFIAVGLAMLVVGYFSPLPPEKNTLKDKVQVDP